MKDEGCRMNQTDSFILHPSAFILRIQLALELLRALVANLVVREVDVVRDFREAADAFVFVRALREVARGWFIHCVTFVRGCDSLKVYPERSRGISGASARQSTTKTNRASLDSFVEST